MNKINRKCLALCVSLIGLMPGEGCGQPALVPIRRIEVQAVDIEVPEILLAQLRQDREKTALQVMIGNNQMSAAASGIVQITGRTKLDQKSELLELPY